MSKLESFLETVVLFLMTALAVLVVVGVGFRKAGAALVWYDELASILLAWLTYYGACLAALRNAHIGFPKFVAATSPATQRALILTREAIVVGFFLLVAWAGWQVQRVLAGTYLVSMPSIPTGLAHSVIPVGALLFVIAELASARQRLAVCAGSEGSPGGPAASPLGLATTREGTGQHDREENENEP